MQAWRKGAAEMEPAKSRMTASCLGEGSHPAAVTTEACKKAGIYSSSFRIHK